MAKTFVKKTREEKKQEIEKITEELDEEVRKIFDSDNYKKYLKTMSRFHNYSFNNTMLIAMQRPDATLVASFVSWKNNFHRNVKKGEKGIKILAPAPIKKTAEVEAIDPETNKRIIDENGRPVTETVQMTIPFYKVAYVYDIGQTEGEELPSLGVNELTAEVIGYGKIIKAIESVSPVPVSYEDIEGTAKGYYSLNDKRIVVQKGMSESQTVKTLLHEIAHSLVHDKEGPLIDGIDRHDTNRSTKEVEAEGAAYTVMSFLNLDEKVGDYSFSYIAGWSSGRDVKELKASMETIRKTASHIITGIEEKLMERTSIKERLATGEAKKAEHAVKEKPNKTKARQEPVLA